MAKQNEKVIVADVVDEPKKTTESEAPKQEAEATEEKKVGFMTKAKNKLSDWWHKPGPSPEDRFKKAAKVGAVVGLGLIAYGVGKKAQEAKEFAALDGEASETPTLPGDTEVVEEVVDYVDEPYVEEYAE